MAANPVSTPKLSLQQINALAEAQIKSQAIDRWQQIYTTSYSGSAGNIAGQVVQFPLVNVGLCKKLRVVISAQVNVASGETLTLTPLGAANILSNITLNDTSNLQRVNTSGLHLNLLSSAKTKFPFLGSIVSSSTDTPLGFGNNWTNVENAPASISASPSGNNVFAMVDIPLAYNDDDLRGALFLALVNATSNCTLTINPQFFAASSASDATASVYQSSTTVTQSDLHSVTITVYQNYLDQLPMGKSGYILPPIDIQTAYMLNNFTQGGLVQNQDINIPYPTFRDILSTFLLYDNAGTLNAGTDVNRIKIQTANLSNLIDVAPNVVASWTRENNNIDYPKGVYYLSHRRKPINTMNYGNMAVVVNLSSVTNSTANINVMFEALALINQVINAGSITGS